MQESLGSDLPGIAANESWVICFFLQAAYPDTKSARMIHPSGELYFKISTLTVFQLAPCTCEASVLTTG